MVYWSCVLPNSHDSFFLMTQFLRTSTTGFSEHPYSVLHWFSDKKSSPERSLYCVISSYFRLHVLHCSWKIIQCYQPLHSLSIIALRSLGSRVIIICCVCVRGCYPVFFSNSLLSCNNRNKIYPHSPMLKRISLLVTTGLPSHYVTCCTPHSQSILVLSVSRQIECWLCCYVRIRDFCSEELKKKWANM